MPSIIYCPRQLDLQLNILANIGDSPGETQPPLSNDIAVDLAGARPVEVHALSVYTFDCSS